MLRMDLYHASPKVLGLLAFAWVAATSTHWRTRVVACLVVGNGLLCHVCGFVAYDVLCNFVLVIWVNLSTGWQPETLFGSLVALLVFVTSAPHAHDPLCNAMHVVFVQGVLAACLSQW